MKCPHCQKHIVINQVVLKNVEAYRQTRLSACPECKRGLLVIPVFTVELDPYFGDLQEDDWGAKLLK